MKVLVTGNLGYIGSVLTDILKKKNHEVVGYDIGYYKNCLVAKSIKLDKQIISDLRNFDSKELKDIDAVIHLASLSNDPLGEFMPKLTEEINYNVTVNLAKNCKLIGVKRFIFASTQSIYGISQTSDELDEDNSLKNPITTYAKTKWNAEQYISKIANENFCVVSLRPSTVFGPSSRFRSDIVYNNLLGCAYTTKKIEIWSDGSPWRPVVHIDDVCNAFLACLEAPKELINKQSFNVGFYGGNYTVKELAEAAKKNVKGSIVVIQNKTGNDNRTYKVNFNKINSILKDYFKPIWNLENGGEQLLEFFNRIKLDEQMFRGKQTNRLKQLSFLKDSGLINNRLEYV